jgi:cytochrome c peroxidase
MIRHRRALLGAAVLIAALVWRAWPTSLVHRDTGRGGLQPSSALRRAFEAGVDSLSSALDSLAPAVQSADVELARRRFRMARRAYKHQEVLLAYYTPSTMSILNGPVAEDDDAPPRPLGELAAFQRVERVLFDPAAPDAAARDSAHRDVLYMRDAVAHFRALTGYLDVRELAFLDAARTELARVSVLSLAEVDSDESGDAVIESADALDGIRALARVAAHERTSRAPAEAWTQLDVAIARAATRLRAEPNVETLDRLDFLAGFAEPMGRAIARTRGALGPVDVGLRVVWRPDAATMFDAGALDASAYAPDFAVRASPQAIALGERLFNDRRLSGPQTQSCASCHVPSLAFTDGLVRHAALGTRDTRVARNTPTLLNVALHPAFFADDRARTLEDQVGAVLASPTEMASSAETATTRIAGDTSYRRAFAAVIPAGQGALVTSATLRAVLATYVRSLVRLDSRFDRAVRGDATALTGAERHGFTVFMGKARCGTCHFAPLFSGAAPPDLVRSEPEIIGVPVRDVARGAAIDPDSGRAGVDHIAEHLHAFKVPTLRNVARTAPYMHNGVFASLEQVVDFYDRGGGLGIGASVPAQTLSSRPLHLTPAERSDLLAFLRSLTDRDPDRP